MRLCVDRVCVRVSLSVCWSVRVCFLCVCVLCGYASTRLALPGALLVPVDGSGMWDCCEQLFSQSCTAAASTTTRPTTTRLGLDKRRSFYVGDAAGRFRDHSDCDSYFVRLLSLWQQRLQKRQQHQHQLKGSISTSGKPGHHHTVSAVGMGRPQAYWKPCLPVCHFRNRF